MDYVEKARKLEEHISKHPTDYQAVIAHLIMRSKAFEHEKHMQMIERRKRVAEFRRKLDEQEQSVE